MFTFKLTVFNEFNEVAETIESTKPMKETDVKRIVTGTIFDLSINERFELEMEKVATDTEIIVEDDKKEILVCNDCLQPIVNGDFSALDYWYRPKQARERMEAVKDGMEKLTENGEHLALGDKRVEFAKSPCECCGSTLHGERHEIVVLQSDTVKDGKK